MKTIIHNGKIYMKRGCFAQALMIEDGVITDAGSNDRILAIRNGADEIYDCGGGTVLPGLNDSHLHLMQYGETLNQADIENASSVDDLIERCRSFIKSHPDKVKNGLHAMGWNQDLFKGEKRMPNRHDLDKISTHIPIVLERVCGHIASVNTCLMEKLGTDPSTEGILRGDQCLGAKEAVPDFTMDEKRQIITDTMKKAASFGLTSLQSNDIGADFSDSGRAFAMMRDIYAKNEAAVRYHYQMCFESPDEFSRFLASEEFTGDLYPEDSWLTLGPLKLYKDGSLGARTAYMKDGYACERDNHGLQWLSCDEMDRYCALARDAGVQVVTHAIGSRAIDEAISSYEKAFVDGKNKLRHAIIHCQITDEDIINRIADLDILVMAQPVFIDYDMHIVEELCGRSLASTSYAFGTLLRKGVHLSYGTDCPVETCNPFLNIYEAVTRKDRNGYPENGFYPDERVDVETAIDAYTLESAYAQFAEKTKGRLSPGFCADLTLIDRDIFTVPHDDIKDIKPLMTMTGGRIVYKA